MFLGLLHDLGGMVAVVGSVGSAVVVVGLGEDKDVVAAAEGVLEDGGRAEIDIGVVSGGLVGRGTIKVPNAELADVGDFLGDGLGAKVRVEKWREARRVPSSSSEGRRRHQPRRLEAGGQKDVKESDGDVHSAWTFSPWSRAR